ILAAILSQPFRALEATQDIPTFKFKYLRFAIAAILKEDSLRTYLILAAILTCMWYIFFRIASFFIDLYIESELNQIYVIKPSWNGTLFILAAILTTGGFQTIYGS
ncbi:hypothetical protein ACJX0J_022767, partial [Zea mays]